MALQVPPFNQYQAPLVPLRGLWNAAPAEGDRFVNVTIEWLVTTTQNAVQFALAGNSPVSLSQIVALAVDNGGSGADVDFVFPDSGFVLTVPAHNQGVFPVFTNALMFYAVAQTANPGDQTIFQILNSLPPPIPITPSVEQNHSSVAGLPLVNSTNPLIGPVNGTLNAISMTVSTVGAGVGQIALVDGSNRTIWQSFIASDGGDRSTPLNISGLSLRFIKGVNLVISLSTFTGSNVVANLYYSTP